jgi:hypothetical protein
MRASSLPIWLSGLTYPPTYTFSVIRELPDRIAESLTYSTRGGQDVTVESVNRLIGGAFVSRGSGLALLSTSKWSISGLSDDGVVAIVRYEKTRLSAEGVNVLVREGHVRPSLRSEVASSTEQFGLSLEDFASITWFDQTRE